MKCSVLLINSDFDFDGDEALLMLLKQALLPNQSGKYKMGRAPSDDVRADLDIDKLEKASLEMQDKELLVTKMNAFLEEVSPPIVGGCRGGGEID